MEKKQQSSKTEIISFRLSADEYAPYREAIEKAGISKSEFFRNVFLNLEPTVIIKERKRSSKDYQRLLFVANKSSNNLNQIAHQMNLAAKKKIINQSIANRAINYLADIQKNLRKAVRDAG